MLQQNSAYIKLIYLLGVRNSTIEKCYNKTQLILN